MKLADEIGVPAHARELGRKHAAAHNHDFCEQAQEASAMCEEIQEGDPAAAAALLPRGLATLRGIEARAASPAYCCFDAATFAHHECAKWATAADVFMPPLPQQQTQRRPSAEGAARGAQFAAVAAAAAAAATAATSDGRGSRIGVVGRKASGSGVRTSLRKGSGSGGLVRGLSARELRRGPSAQALLRLQSAGGGLGGNGGVGADGQQLFPLLSPARHGRRHSIGSSVARGAPVRGAHTIRQPQAPHGQSGGQQEGQQQQGPQYPPLQRHSSLPTMAEMRERAVGRVPTHHAFGSLPTATNLLAEGRDTIGHGAAEEAEAGAAEAAGTALAAEAEAEAAEAAGTALEPTHRELSKVSSMQTLIHNKQRLRHLKSWKANAGGDVKPSKRKLKRGKSRRPGGKKKKKKRRTGELPPGEAVAGGPRQRRRGFQETNVAEFSTARMAAQTFVDNGQQKPRRRGRKTGGKDETEDQKRRRARAAAKRRRRRKFQPVKILQRTFLD